MEIINDICIISLLYLFGNISSCLLYFASKNKMDSITCRKFRILLLCIIVFFKKHIDVNWCCDYMLDKCCTYILMLYHFS